MVVFFIPGNCINLFLVSTAVEKPPGVKSLSSLCWLLARYPLLSSTRPKCLAPPNVRLQAPPSAKVYTSQQSTLPHPHPRLKIVETVVALTLAVAHFHLPGWCPAQIDSPTRDQGVDWVFTYQRFYVPAVIGVAHLTANP